MRPLNTKVISQHYCFVHNGSYFLTTLSVLASGKIECWGSMTETEFLEKVQSGWITIDVPDGTEVRIGDQGFVFKQANTLNPDGSTMFMHKWISKESFVADVLDSVQVAQGHESAASICYQAYEIYCTFKTDKSKETLRLAYFNVPEHSRRFILGDQDLKDGPIRSILGIK